MSICKKCGFEVRSTSKFCPKCGTQIEHDTDAVKSEEHQIDDIPSNAIIEDKTNISEEKNDPIKFKESFEKLSVNFIKVFRKIPKLYLEVTIVVVVIIAVAIGSGSYIFSKDRALSRFKSAMTSHKANEIAKILSEGSSGVEINEKTIQPLIKYMDKNPQWLNLMLDSIKQQSDKVGGEAAKLALSSKEASSPDIVFINKGKKFLIFNKYAFEIKPYYINLNMKLKNSKVSLNEGTPVVSDKDNYTAKLGPFIPGIYQLKSSFEEKYLNVKKDMDIELISSHKNLGASQNTIDVNINFDEIVFVQVSSDYDNAKIYVDGKDSGVLVKDANKFGPLSSSSEIYAENIVDGKAIQSDKAVIGNNNSIYLKFPSIKKPEPDTEAIPSGAPVFNKVSASSDLKEVNFNHEPKLVYDGDKTTAWVEGSSDDGIGQWVELYNDSLQSVSGIDIINGYSKSTKSYYSNNRAAKIKVDFSNGKSLTYDLQDGIMDTQRLNFGEVIKTQYIKITILQVYKGNTYSDTCISEINAY
ncbi:discoidin domain-containing protein [Clostridium sp. YIM B02515]|uniref:Discoidin domain-containing protein n=1 Tax=Clostridium rhizosphaerae TaxID=2803861 RepID=A0ABS1T9X5_9CLOT|nr:discoidin domain-containing protein [Clostridium rhizosphaerae]MBL4935557.1 discoidin domain-containing protein [Clostridium rhizosphaerae]